MTSVRIILVHSKGGAAMLISLETTARLILINARARSLPMRLEEITGLIRKLKAEGFEINTNDELEPSLGGQVFSKLRPLIGGLEEFGNAACVNGSLTMLSRKGWISQAKIAKGSFFGAEQEKTRDALEKRIREHLAELAATLRKEDTK